MKTPEESRKSFISAMFNQAEEHAMNVHILLTMQVIVIALRAKMYLTT